MEIPKGQVVSRTEKALLMKTEERTMVRERGVVEVLELPEGCDVQRIWWKH